jgi:hypothetical protein
MPAMSSASRCVSRVVILGCLLIHVIGGVSVASDQDAPVGRRPYEMDWAGRTEDTRPPTVDFESPEPWEVEVQDAVARFSRSREQQLFGQYVGRLVYRSQGPQPRVTLRPPAPVPLPLDFDCVNVWVYGNNWAWVPDASTPQVALTVLLRSAQGSLLRVPLGSVNWKEWWLMHRRLSDEQLAALGPGAVWEGLEITGGRNREDRVLFFDNLCFYREPLPPLTFEPRPSRGVESFPGQCSGTNTGPGQLPFPNRPETILPDNLTRDFTASLTQEGDAYLFVYDGDDGRLEYRYEPVTGTFRDVSAAWSSDGRTVRFRPMEGGGVRFGAADGQTVAGADRIELLDCQRLEDTVVSRWRCHWGAETAEVRYTFRLWQKSLVVDVACPGGWVHRVDFGSATGVDQPRLVTVPYLTGAEQRPAVLVSGPVDHPLFLMGLIDPTRSNASELWFENAVRADRATYNGGARYLPKTDGRRNDCLERLFLTVSPRFEEVLPNVPNPKSPWMHVAGQRVWRAHAASNRERDYALWQRVARHGMTKIALTDHETGWRDGGESFTFRTRAAPGKGGDQAQAEYARKIRALGFRYGIYNNYTDFAPVNEFWHEDMVTRLPDGQWRTAWPRCYNPKPARAVEYATRLAPIIQQKFQLDTAYCDVHTAVQPWRYCDFDARVPGAGTFAATFYAYGEIMLHQKATWNGPVYSEGNHHWYYCGLTDGNYAQDQSARLSENPWLVDFDLLKLHPLCCNFGMGNLEMFFGRRQGLGDTPEQQTARLDQFLAATLAFGHTGFLVMEGGMNNAIRSYFSVQQLHARYARAKAAEIRYADDEGRLWDTSAAVANQAYRRSQVATRYDNGVRVIVNGHPTETWTTDDAVLPPFGWAVRDESRGDLAAFSALLDGHRADYVDSPAYLYADPRGRFVRFDKLACDGPLIVLRDGDDAVEVIPVASCTHFGVSLDGAAASAVALDEARVEIGPTPTRISRDLVYVQPVDGAFSYRLTRQKPPELSLRSERRDVVPGEVVAVWGRESHAYQVPADARPGTLLWQEFDGQWIDFLVRPLVDAQLELADQFRLQMVSHAPQTGTAEIAFDEQSRTAELAPGTPLALEFPLSRPTEEVVRELPLNVKLDSLTMQHRWWLKWEEATQVLAEFTAESRSGQRMRGGDETGVAADSGAQAYWAELSCGNVTKPGLFLHPPYRGGVGYAFAVFEPIDLPRDLPAVFRCEIGKRDGSDPGDGILFRVAVVSDEQAETVVAEQQWIQHAWTPLTADLSPWAGQRVRIKLIADVGPSDNSSGDWACWSGMSIESARPVLTASVHDQPVSLRFESGPYPPPELTAARLRSAVRGAIHYQGIGLQSSGQYISHALLNGVPLGPLPAAGGVEREGIWSTASLALTPAAIAELDVENTFTIDNRGRDYFKIGRLWIELEMADGQQWSSQVNTTVFTQPPDWPYAEGVRVPFSQSITVPLRWRAER